VQRARTSKWIEGYVRAWNSNAPDDIAALFTEDAVYFTEPYKEPWRGVSEIVREWIARKDEPGTTQFTYTIIALDGDVRVVEGRTKYETDPPIEYANLWVIRLDPQGRCSEFTEWWMEVKPKLRESAS
jgi:ketosteroid isomerase-like protein